jgi:hypothetical protein
VRRAQGEAVDPAALAAAGREALRWVVPNQIAAGTDGGNNGEQQREGLFRCVLLIPVSCSPDPNRILQQLLADETPVTTAALRVRRSGQALPGGGGIAI